MVSSRFSLLFLLGTLLAVPAPAQQAESPDREASIRGEARASFVVGVPRQSFRDNIDGLGYGGTLFGGARLGDTPIVLGLDLGFLVYGRTVDTVPFSGTVGPRVTVDVVTTNSILEPHLVLRLQPADGRVRPYVDGLVGFKYLFTETKVRDEDVGNDDRDIASTTNFSDVALSGGVAGGVDVRLYRPAADAEIGTVSLHLGAQYLVGQRAEYLAEGSLEDTNGNGRLDDSELPIRRSTTTLLQPQIGVTVQF
ncbi:MAG: hypothetical protein ACLFTE_09790 [Salinivenus sp.]